MTSLRRDGKVEQVLTGDLSEEVPFTTNQIAMLEKVLYRARKATGVDFAIYVGPMPEGRESAVDLHRLFQQPELSVLVAIDPGERALEIVTGVTVREFLDDQSCRLACLTMNSRFALGDLASGLRDGINVLSEHARSVETLGMLHTELPE